MLLFCEHAFRIGFSNTERCSGKVDDAAFCERGAQTLLQNPYEIEDAFSTQNREKTTENCFERGFRPKLVKKWSGGLFWALPGPLWRVPGALLGVL